MTSRKLVFNKISLAIERRLWIDFETKLFLPACGGEIMAGQTGDILTAVREYTNRGWVIHPLSRLDDDEHIDTAGKRPILSGWQKLTVTPDNIEDYLKKGCNIGLVCGQSSRVTLLDLDHELFLAELTNGFELDTLKGSRTKGRGHLYFMYEKDLKAQKHHDLGIEILNDGSNAVLPPSVHKSGDVYRWNNPNTPIIKMPAKLKENLLNLFKTEAELKQILATCRHCFRTVLKKRDAIDWHGAEGREYMLAVCTDLKAEGASEDHARMFAKLIYREKYDEKQTMMEWRNIDANKTWRCETLKAKLPSYLDLSECEKCDEKRKKTKFSGVKKTDVFEVVNKVQSKTPIVYDRNKNYWLWDVENQYYQIVDETEALLTVLYTVGNPDIIKNDFKSQVLEAIRLTGRDSAHHIKDVPKTWVHFQNGVIDIKKGNRIPLTPDYLFTAPIPHRLGNSTETPTIDRLFTEWVGAEKKQLLYEVCAYCLLDDYPIHRIILIFGRGRNGKRQYVEILIRLVGHDNVTSTSIDGLIGSRFESARLFKKKIATIGETNFALLKDTAIIKMLSGGDPIPAEFKNKMPFDFYNTAKIIISTNSLPYTTDKTDGFYSRWVIIDFPNQFDEGIDIVNTIPASEYDNLLAKCVTILQELVKKGKFTGEGTIEDRRKSYEDRSNPVKLFIETYCIRDGREKEPAWKMFEKFQEFRQIRGFREITQIEFNKVLKKEGYEVEKKKIGDNNWVWVFGLKLREEGGLKNEPK